MKLKHGRKLGQVWVREFYTLNRAGLEIWGRHGSSDATTGCSKQQHLPCAGLRYSSGPWGRCCVHWCLAKTCAHINKRGVDSGHRGELCSLSPKNWEHATRVAQATNLEELISNPSSNRSVVASKGGPKHNPEP